MELSRSQHIDYSSQVWTLDKDYKPFPEHCTLKTIKIGDEIMFMPSFIERYHRDLLKVYIIREIKDSIKGTGKRIILDVKNSEKWTALGEPELSNYLHFDNVMKHHGEYFV